MCVFKSYHIYAINTFYLLYYWALFITKQTKIDSECESKAIGAFVTFERCTNPRFDRKNGKSTKNKEKLMNDLMLLNDHALNEPFFNFKLKPKQTSLKNSNLIIYIFFLFEIFYYLLINYEHPWIINIVFIIFR